MTGSYKRESNSYNELYLCKEKGGNVECVKEILCRLNESRRVDEMANVSKSDTDLPYDIWIDSEGANRKVKHNTPRVKVDVGGDRIPVSISKDPKILAGKRCKTIPHISEVFKWIIKYHEVLMKHWNKEISDKEALNQLGD